MGGAAVTGFLRDPTPDDPYRYQCGFGNHHATEAIPGALPRSGTNLPQKARYGLYPEHLNGTSFISSRDTVSNVWLYRERPGAPHSSPRSADRPHEIESSFLPTNPNVHFAPHTHTWGPLTPLSNTTTTFVQGLKTIGGNGDATLKEGVAVHQYAFNADMHRQAFVNHDGDMLLVPQRGVLDIKTELGCLRVKPGTIAVLPAGIRYSIRTVPEDSSPPTPVIAAGYALEVFGTRFILPELGVLGGNGLAHVRDFEYPVAAFDLESLADTTHLPPWEITMKLSGRLYSYNQPHSPFDVVAWHGKHAPFRYDLSRFHHLVANSDQLDPTAFCVLTAPSKWPGVSQVDFCIFGEKWCVAQDTPRIPYYHRTMATELVGIIKGEYKGKVRALEAGGLSLEQAYMPHGETYESYMRDAEAKKEPVKVMEGYLGFMFHVSGHVGLTGWARERHPDMRAERPGVWDSFRSHLLDHIDEANASLARAGMKTLQRPQPPTPPDSPAGTIVPPDDGTVPVPGGISENQH
ncbi:putative homogentisate 1,2-dioxygenase [Podospora aff. communis PSN243]|uniref:homogentisate 1,2-dioxygenase n=1 Tax=Podospora aff. communis PSN243 TaxID=3040156 RepID=A0AAV9G6H9_9PEZI|nr:putative homogentisate 1,2-dioxygenase [Podospora aff. communis PSN243]